MELEVSKMKGENELILCIVDAGFSDSVMSAARECGARGGTVLSARGFIKMWG